MEKRNTSTLPPPPQPPTQKSRVGVSEMETPPISSSAVDEPVAGAAWEWGNLLDFSIDDNDQFVLPWSSEDNAGFASPLPLQEEEEKEGEEASPAQTSMVTTTTTGAREGVGRIRKRDPRLLCENFLAGRVPCSCPEVDEEEEDDDEAVVVEEGVVVGVGAVGGGKKRARTGGAAAAARCQVPGCEVDISELKGYHRRHRVCLRCANAASVLLDGEAKRYCQQCGKFHVLTDFDEGKRSCRRKLERHNKRRRRRPTDKKGTAGKEKGNLEIMHVEDVDCDVEKSKDSLNEGAHGSDSLCTSDKTIDAETPLESEGRGSPFCSDPGVRTGHSNTIASFAVSSEAQIEDKMDNPRSAISSSFSENKITYPIVCPTGRISFKLYDWNPAEFPRRLRHQIFQWLSNMPVELEGYIRPGCTILTIFIAMPQSMWRKLSEDASRYLHDLVKEPESLLFRKGHIQIYLNNTIFQVLKDGTSLVDVKMEVQVPKLHYVHPIFFEAGKPMEIVACGSNLLKPKFRFLVSFSGKYLKYESCHVIHHENTRVGVRKDFSQVSEHQMFRIKIPQTEEELFGPAFIEVENESGLSNFIPVLFADKHICSELQGMQQRFNLGSDVISQHTEVDAIPCLSEVSISRQSSLSELLLDIAWLLKEPQRDGHETFFSVGNIQRLNCLLSYLVQTEAVNVLRKVLHYVETFIDGKELDDLVNRVHPAELRLLKKYMTEAKEFLHQKLQHDGSVGLGQGSQTYKAAPLQQSDVQSNLRYTRGMEQYQKHEMKTTDVSEWVKDPTSGGEAEDITKNTMTCTEDDALHLRVKRTPETFDYIFSRTITSTRLAVLVMATIVVCFGVCIVLFHPHKAGEFAVSVRRCVFDGPKM